MKVVLLAPTPPPAGGIAGWTVRMKQTKLKNNCMVIVVDEKPFGRKEIFVKKKNLIHEILRSITIWKNLFISLQDKDVLVVHSCIPSTTTAMLRELICLLITKLLKRKFIVHYRCTVPNLVKTKVSLKVFKLFSNQCDLIITINQISLTFCNLYTKTTTKMIPNFIEYKKIVEKNTRIISPEVKKIIYIGGVIEKKGCLGIIEVAKHFPHIQFNLIGQSSDDIIKLKKTKNVALLGEQSRNVVETELSSSDLFLFLTYFPGEGFSNALLEAMAAGLPCIATNWAANKDMIECHGGIIVPTRNTQSVIDAIEKVRYDSHLRKSQSNWNIQKVKDNYTDSIVTSSYVDAYESVLKNK